jgi:subtilisin family serine protease
MVRRIGFGLLLVACAALAPRSHAQVPRGGSYVRALGLDPESIVAPGSRRVGALVELPAGTSAASLGLDEVAPGIGRMRVSAAEVVAFGAAHPDLRVEVVPPLHTLLDRASIYIRTEALRTIGADGTGTLVGIADTGLDVTHPDFRDPKTNKSRVAWMLDLSMKALGLHPELEAKYGVKDAQGNLQGAVLTGQDIDDLIAQAKPVPVDRNGHGTHVASIAAGNGGGTRFIGAAPKAGLVIARISRTDLGSFDGDDALRGAAFIFDRADEMKLPVALNYSLGTDFGPHDGTSLWERTLASHVGPAKPGHAFVVAAGNSGSIAEAPIHQSVYVTPGAAVRVPIATSGAKNGAVQVWVTLRKGADVKVGLDGPNGTWISPIGDQEEKGYNSGGVNAAVLFGTPSSTVPADSHGAVVLWRGAWPTGTYSITLSGSGMAELYLYSSGDASLESFTPAYFRAGVREGTVSLPATHPDLITVGCTVSGPDWKAISGQRIALSAPLLDEAGGLRDPSRARRPFEQGELCYFSAAGPTAAGVPKPDIAAPGAIIVGAMSLQAKPDVQTSVFHTSSCPPNPDTNQVDDRCLQVDATHAVSQGTSMSAPMVAGATALLFQRDPTLTQDVVRALLQAGAHKFRGPAPFFDQAGPGELDAEGSLAALDEMKNPTLVLPSAKASWASLSADYVTADGSTPLTVILELRTDSGKRASLFELARLQPVVTMLGRPVIAAPEVRRSPAPGVFSYQVVLPRGLGGRTVTLGATFDGENVVSPITIPVATDTWTANYLGEAKGACSVASGPTPDGGGAVGLAGGALAVAVLRRRRSRRS